jgi:hypothetical protein
MGRIVMWAVLTCDWDFRQLTVEQREGSGALPGATQRSAPACPTGHSDFHLQDAGRGDMANQGLDGFRRPTAAQMRCAGNAMRLKSPNIFLDEGRLEVSGLAHVWGKSQFDVEVGYGVTAIKCHWVSQDRQAEGLSDAGCAGSAPAWFGAVDGAGDDQEKDQVASELTSVRSGKADLLKRVCHAECHNHDWGHGKNEQQVETDVEGPEEGALAEIGSRNAAPRSSIGRLRRPWAREGREVVEPRRMSMILRHRVPSRT